MYLKDKDTGAVTVIDRREMLRVKVKNLAAEAALIRHEERKLQYRRKKEVVLCEGKPDFSIRVRRPVPCPMLYKELHDHRVKDLRRHARLAHLALGFIKGRTLQQMEQKTHRPLSERDWEKINAMVKKYGPVKGVVEIKPSFVAPYPGYVKEGTVVKAAPVTVVA